MFRRSGLTAVLNTGVLQKGHQFRLLASDKPKPARLMILEQDAHQHLCELIAQLLNSPWAVEAFAAPELVETMSAPVSSML
jgi:hypothetical protein